MTLPYCWRVTKYNPAFRNARGFYEAEDWTAFSEIGNVYAGEQLTYAKYLTCENAYVSSAMRFLSDAGLCSLRVAQLEKQRLADVEADDFRDVVFDPRSLQVGSIVGGNELENIIRLNLRSVLWCKLKATRFYLHFGYDFYMYVGSTAPSHGAIAHAQQKGLFVEQRPSPYL